MASTALASRATGVKADTPDLRRSIYAEGDPTRFDLERLIALGRSVPEDPEFAELLADVAVDAFVRGVDPPGYLDEADAAWLISRLTDGGGLASSAEFQMLKALIGHAISVPSALTHFAVREVEKAIVSGRRGPIGGADPDVGKVTAADVETLRALAFAPTRAHSLHVDRATAETLFDVARATAHAENAPEFAPFFAQAVGNCLLGADFIGTPEREDVLRHESELARPGGFGVFLAAMVGRRPEIGRAFGTIGDDQEDADRAINVETERRLEAASHINAEQAGWLLAHLGRSGELTDAEKRLLAFLRDEAASAPPELTRLYAEAA